MNILGFDTCFNACSVAVGQGIGGATPHTDEFWEPMATGHAERLLPMVAEAMAAAGLRFDQLDRIAVTVGPGTFTGARIGVAAARALGLALGCPVVGLSSLEVMAAHHLIEFDAERTDLAIAVDARRGQVYVQLFPAAGLADGALQAGGPPQLLTIEDAALGFGRAPVTIAGSGAQAVAEAARRLGAITTAILPDLQPDIGDILLHAARLEPAGEPVRPLYLRPPDAKPQSGKAIPRLATGG